MATQKLSEVDVIGQIAADLGLDVQELDAMSIEQIAEIVASGDIEPSIKMKLVRAKLQAAAKALELADTVMADASEPAAPAEPDMPEDDAMLADEPAMAAPAGRAPFGR